MGLDDERGREAALATEGAEAMSRSDPPLRGCDLSGLAGNGQDLSGSMFGSQAVARLRAVFTRSRHPMLIADDQRRWVTANAAACDLLGIAREEVPWHTMDDFTPPSERERLTEQWQEFLTSGAAEGQYPLYIPERGVMPVEFSATANVLPARHLSLFIPPDEPPTERVEHALTREAAWHRSWRTPAESRSSPNGSAR